MDHAATFGAGDNIPNYGMIAHRQTSLTGNAFDGEQVIVHASPGWCCPRDGFADPSS